MEFPVKELMSEFATEAVYINPTGERSTINCLFESQYVEAQMFGAGGAVAATAKMATCDTADVADADVTATLIIADVTYKIVSVQPDGQGLTTLMLTLETL